MVDGKQKLRDTIHELLQSLIVDRTYIDKDVEQTQKIQTQCYKLLSLLAKDD